MKRCTSTGRAKRMYISYGKITVRSRRKYTLTPGKGNIPSTLMQPLWGRGLLHYSYRGPPAHSKPLLSSLVLLLSPPIFLLPSSIEKAKHDFALVRFGINIGTDFCSTLEEVGTASTDLTTCINRRPGEAQDTYSCGRRGRDKRSRGLLWK